MSIGIWRDVGAKALSGDGRCNRCGGRMYGHGWKYGYTICGDQWAVVNDEIGEVWLYAMRDWMKKDGCLVNKRSRAWCDEWSINGKPRKIKSSKWVRGRQLKGLPY